MGRVCYNISQCNMSLTQLWEAIEGAVILLMFKCKIRIASCQFRYTIAYEDFDTSYILIHK